MSALLDLWTVVTVTCGLIFFVAGTVGLVRLPDTLTRLHALAKADTLGAGLIVLGLLPQANGVLAGLKLLAVWALVLLSSATVAQLIGRAARAEEERR